MYDFARIFLLLSAVIARSIFPFPKGNYNRLFINTGRMKFE